MEFVIYPALVGTIIAIEHFTFGRLWKGNEFARRVMGEATILLCALLFVPLVDLRTIVFVAVGTGAAGAVMGALLVTEVEMKKRKQADEKRRLIEQHDEPAA